MRYLIVDLEATCWRKGSTPERMEIIEIGAVMLESAIGPISGEFAEFVRPVRKPVLSRFCKELTSIRQNDVDAAGEFTSVFERFLNWVGNQPFTWCSWGAYDLKQLRIECERRGIAFPESFERHINLKRAFTELQGVRPTGMNGALEMLGIPLQGTHHRGIDDARNIAKIAQIILPQIQSGI